MMRAITALLIAACAVLQSPAAQAQSDRRERIEARLKAADTDDDDLISRAEGERAFPKQVERFDEIDLNRDGYLSRDEFAAFAAKRRSSVTAAGKS